MYFQIRHGKGRSTVQALRTHYIPARKRTVSSVVFSFDADTLELERGLRSGLSTEEKAALAAFLTARRAELERARLGDALLEVRPALRGAGRALDAELPLSRREASAIHHQILHLQQALHARGFDPPTRRAARTRRSDRRKGVQLQLLVD